MIYRKYAADYDSEIAVDETLGAHFHVYTFNGALSFRSSSATKALRHKK